MASHMKRCLLHAQQVAITQVRFQGKINIQRPRPKTRERRMFEAITKPIYPPSETLGKCSNVLGRVERTTDTEVNAYQQFLLRGCKKLFEVNKMVIICQALPMSANNRLEIRNTLKRSGMDLFFYNNNLMRAAVRDTHLVNLTPYFCGQNLYIISPEIKVTEAVKTLRRVPQLHIAGALLDNYILGREDVLRCAKLPPLDRLRGELLSLLSMPASRTHSLLGSHQGQLSRNLEQYVKDKQCDGES